MVALTGWGWAGLGAGVLVGVAVLLVAIGLSSRKRFRLALVEHLRRTAPDVAITAVHQDRLELRFPSRGADATGTFHLERFYDLMTASAGESASEAAAARAAILDVVVQAIREGATALDASALDGAALDGAAPAASHAAVLPRIVADDALAQLRAQVGAATLPSRPAGVAGLSIVLVLDRDASVAYLTDGLLADLRLTVDAAFDLAYANLARTFGPDLVRATVRSGDLSVLRTCDSFDAARLLLVPGYLEAGESLVALIPDRDTLMLVTPPADGDWAGLRRLARTADGSPLYAEPLLVTTDGFARAA